MAAANEEAKTVQSPEKHLPQFGPRMLQHFLFDPSYRNLNHGSFGTCPREVQKQLRHYQDLVEARPDPFIRYDFPNLLDESRAAIAKLLNAPMDTVVFVPNATMAANTVLRNLQWNDEGNDEILYFNTVYGACGATINYIVDSCGGKVASREITLTYPCEDEEILEAFRGAVEKSTADGKRARVCLFDAISSQPGVRFPFEEMTKACKDLGVLSLIDGAHGVGQIQIDLTDLDPDFFFSNCHKWLHVPRGCAVFYVPLRNQELIPSTVPTSHGYVSKKIKRFNPLPPRAKSVFVNNFEFVGTIDSSPYLCVKDAIKWREKMGGEKRIMEYTQNLAKEGGKRVAEIMGTEIMENTKGTLTNCAMVNVTLPIQIVTSGGAAEQQVEAPPPKEKGLGTTEALEDTAAPKVPEAGPASIGIVISSDEASAATQWMMETSMKDYKTFIVILEQGDRMWARLSAQVYLDLEDFDWAGRTLLELCERVGKGEHKGS